MPQFEAPTYVTWSTVNRADLIRVPDFKPGREESRRIEYRSPDPACQPVSGVQRYAGGRAERHREPANEFPLAAQSNALHMSQSERDELGINALPANLWEAIAITEQSELVRDALGEPVFKSFIENKKIEWENYHSRVADYETEHYLAGAVRAANGTLRDGIGFSSPPS